MQNSVAQIRQIIATSSHIAGRLPRGRGGGGRGGRAKGRLQPVRFVAGILLMLKSQFDLVSLGCDLILPATAPIQASW